MSFCIECGAKLPEKAKFCPQCGAAVGTPETEDITEAVPVTLTSGADISVAEQVETHAKDDVSPTDDTPPSISESLAVTADAMSVEPKSKTELFFGLGLLALLAAGGGAYMAGLFDTNDKYVTQTASVPVVKTPTVTAEVESLKEDNTKTNTVLAAYQEAIKSGRISALGQFAQNHPDHSLAKDAEAAAFDSLKRQNSVLAYSTFTTYFPDSDTRSYIGPRVNSDIESETDAQQTVETAVATASEVAPSIRSSISSRADELMPFIDQGNGDYAVAVIDEMLSLTDLTETEATYLLNLRAKAETASGFTTASSSEVFVPEANPAVDMQPTTIDITPEFVFTETEAEITTAVEAIQEPVEAANMPKLSEEIGIAAEPEVTTKIDTETATEIAAETENPAPAAPSLAYDTAAKPIERFGAVTPDAATEPGECDMIFSINTSGKPVNILAMCSDPIFIDPATETVGEWSYEPAKLNDIAVQQDDVTVKIKFHLE